MKKIIFVIAVMALMVVSCAQEQQQPAQPLIGSQPEQEQAPSTPAEEPVPVPEVKKEYSKDITSLIEKSKKINDYSYQFKLSGPDSEGSYRDLQSYTAYIKGTKAKKLYGQAVKLNPGIYYTEIYLDSAKETAYAVCKGPKMYCDPIINNAYKLNYEEQKLSITPLGIISSLDYGAEKKGEETVDNRKTAKVESVSSEGNNQRDFIDNFYGIPLMHVIYKMENDREVKLQEGTFYSVSVNSVTNADVEMPSTYTIIN